MDKEGLRWRRVEEGKERGGGKERDRGERMG